MRLRRALTLVPCVVVLAACGGSGHHRSTTSTSAPPPPRPPTTARLAVAPATPRPTSTVRFDFVAPRSTGIGAGGDISYLLSIVGPQRGGCVSAHSAGPPRALAGRRTTVALGPAQLGGPWCAGEWTARVFELERAACEQGQICPQYVRVVGIVARANFRVAGG
ncbi:MAG: hypothetical protein JOZ07_10390 [Solirubrobacterales bacterium]|nr:hypothetical protein [Solirubrobacterales bacterium]